MNKVTSRQSPVRQCTSHQSPVTSKTLTGALVLWCAGALTAGALVLWCTGALLFQEVYAQETAKEVESLFVAKKAFDDGFYEVSVGLLERFIANYPNSARIAEANLLIGECYFHQNRFLDALAKFEALLNNPLAAQIKDAVFYWIAEVHFKGGNFSKAIDYYKLIINGYPKSVYSMHAYYSLGWCFYQQSSFKDALKYFTLIEEKYPAESLAQETSFKIVECFYNLKEYNGLKDKIKAYIKMYPSAPVKMPYLNFYHGEAEYYLNNFAEAVSWYSKVISGASDEGIKSLSRLSMGWAYLKLKQYKEAKQVFLEIKPENLDNKNKGILLFGQAVLSSEINDFDQAKNIYAELINLASDPVVLMQAYLGQADALYNIGRYDEAVDVYKKALDKQLADTPKEAIDKLHYGLAWAFLKKGIFKEAIDEFQKVAKSADDKIIKISALCQMGDAYQDSGDYEKAVASYDNILKDYPDSFYGDYVQYQLGLTLLKASNYDRAIMAFKSLKNNFPSSTLLDDAYYAMGLAYFQREDYESSKEVFSEFVNIYKDSNLKPQVVYLLGTTYYNLGKFAQAIDIFKDVVKLCSQDSETCQKAEYEIADCLYQLGKEDEAMEKFKALRAKYSDSSLSVEVIWWLGEYYYRHNDLTLARQYFLSLIKDFPKSNLVADAYYILGLSYQEESKYPEALANFKKVIELGGSDLSGQASVAIADMEIKEDKFDLAIALYKEAIAGHPNLSNLIYPKIAAAYQKAGNYDQAIESYRRSLELVSVKQMANIQFKIAEAYQAQGKAIAAIEEYLKVPYLYSDDSGLAARAFLSAAGIYDDQENFKESASIYMKIVSMNVPESKYAQERLDWISAMVK